MEWDCCLKFQILHIATATAGVDERVDELAELYRRNLNYFLQDYDKVHGARGWCFDSRKISQKVSHNIGMLVYIIEKFGLSFKGGMRELSKEIIMPDIDIRRPLDCGFENSVINKEKVRGRLIYSFTDEAKTVVHKICRETGDKLMYVDKLLTIGSAKTPDEISENFRLELKREACIQAISLMILGHYIEVEKSDKYYYFYLPFYP